MPDQPQTITVPYQDPHTRALASATRTGTAAQISLTLAVALLPILSKFFSIAVYTQATVIALVSAMAVATCATLLVYAMAFHNAASSDPVYQQQRATAKQAANTMKLQSQAMNLRKTALRYGIVLPPDSPTPPAAAGYVLAPNAPPHA